MLRCDCGQRSLLCNAVRRLAGVHLWAHHDKRAGGLLPAGRKAASVRVIIVWLVEPVEEIAQVRFAGEPPPKLWDVHEPRPVQHHSGIAFKPCGGVAKSRSGLDCIQQQRLGCQESVNWAACMLRRDGT